MSASIYGVGEMARSQAAGAHLSAAWGDELCNARCLLEVREVKQTLSSLTIFENIDLFSKGSQ